MQVWLKIRRQKGSRSAKYFSILILCLIFALMICCLPIIGVNSIYTVLGINVNSLRKWQRILGHKFCLLIMMIRICVWRHFSVKLIIWSKLLIKKLVGPHKYGVKFKNLNFVKMMKFLSFSKTKIVKLVKLVMKRLTFRWVWSRRRRKKLLVKKQRKVNQDWRVLINLVEEQCQ